MTQASGGRLSAGAIQFRPGYRTEIEAGWVQVEVGERPAGQAGLCGRGGVTITSQGGDVTNEISRVGFARLFPVPECACGAVNPANIIITHELTHALGFFHADPFTSSLMYSRPQIDCATSTLPPLDAYHAPLAHTRPVGNRTPDTDPASFSFQAFPGRRETTFSFACGL